MSATHNGEARIYGLTGQLVKTVPHTAGETVQTTLPRGVYIVAVNGRSYKIIMENGE
ncbi:MAG: T9SS type A sorting domain-containing protein [Tannerella sp.]|nr:T9SS type A sorting domain-containing protein [Tannerella sp.]